MKLIGRVLERCQRPAEPIVAGCAFPREYDDFSKTLVLPAAPKVEDELRWNCAVLRRYDRQLSEFVALRDRYELALLSCNLSEAEEVLQNTIRRLGLSFWAVQAHLVLAQRRGGLAENRSALTTLVAATDNPLVQMYATLLSQKVEDALSASNYESMLDDICAAAPASEEPDVNYFRFMFEFASLRFKPDVRHVLYRNGTHPIVDRYCAYIRCLKTCASDKRLGSSRALHECIGSLGRAIEDRQLRMLTAWANPRLPNPTLAPDKHLALLLNDYTRGSHNKAVELAEEIIAAGTDSFECVEVYCKSLVYLGQKPNIERLPAVGPILSAITSVLERGPATGEAIAYLRKQAYTLDGTRFADQLLAFLGVQGCLRTDLDMDVFGALSGSCISPRFAEIVSEQDKSAFLDNIADWYSRGPVIELFSHQENALPEVVWAPRAIKYRARHASMRGEYEQAIGHYSGLLQSSAGAMPLAHEASMGLCLAYLKDGKVCEAAEVAVDACLDRPEGASAFPIKRIIDHLSRGSRAKLNSIIWPILFTLPLQERRSRDMFRQTYGAYDDFLSAQGVRRPSEFIVMEGSFCAKHIIHFLRYVCIPDVMDSSIAFDSSEDLERERISICQRLLILDEGFSDVYAKEIARRTEALMIRRALQRYGESKIHVDTHGIARSLDRGFAERFLRFRAFSLLTDKLRENLSLRGLRFDTEKPVLVVSDATLQQFEELFDDLRARFISSNEFGLDSYLSVRIRHGTLSGQIRSQFERGGLITRKNAMTARYEHNEHWLARLPQVRATEAREKADEAFRRFSGDVDKLIEEVKQDWLQIRSANKPAGMFDFDYSEKAKVQLYVKVLQIADVDRFVEAVFASLWERTENQLELIRARIAGELSRRLREAIDALESTLSELTEGVRNSELAGTLARCRTSVANELDAIAAWFKVGEEEAVPDYRLRLLADTSKEIIRNCFPNLPELPEIEVEDDSILIRGNTFTAFVDLLFILFENTVRHGQVQLPQVKARVYSHGDRLGIEVRNALGLETNLDALRQKVLSLLEDAKKATGVVRQEGGSGFAKLHKIAKYDLRQSAYLVEVDVQSDRWFVLKVDLSLEGLRT